MGIAEAIKILKRYNRWRRGAEIKPDEPYVIGNAIDRVLEEVQKKATK